MNRPELYNKTVDILYNAYFNDTLECGNCYACAVGNLVAAANGYKMIKTEHSKWGIQWEGHEYPFTNGWGGIALWTNKKHYSKEGLRQIESTGYSTREVVLIEQAFEHIENYSFTTSIDEYMFNGLCNVLEALKKIHDIPDNSPEVTRFRQHYTTKTLTNA